MMKKSGIEGETSLKDVSMHDKTVALNAYIKEIESVLDRSENKEKFVAIGECGLDYDRFEYADAET